MISSEPKPTDAVRPVVRRYLADCGGDPTRAREQLERVIESRAFEEIPEFREACERVREQHPDTTEAEVRDVAKRVFAEYMRDAIRQELS